MIDTLGLSRMGTEILFSYKLNAVVLVEVQEEDEERGVVLMSIHTPKDKYYRKRVNYDPNTDTHMVLIRILTYFVNDIKEKI